jgi:hypothetical protein
MVGDLASFDADTPVGWAETAISTEIDGELVALDVTKGVCYGLNRMGTRIWHLLETPRSARQIADVLTSEFDVEPDICLQQTTDLLRELAVAELVR